jgi:hypothetical protein
LHGDAKLVGFSVKRRLHVHPQTLCLGVELVSLCGAEGAEDGNKLLCRGVNTRRRKHGDV